MARCSLPDTFSGPQTQFKVLGEHFAMELVDPAADRDQRNLFQTDTPQSRELVVTNIRVKYHD